MQISVLASGSSGNCVFLESKDTAILVDAGLSSRRIAKLLGNIGKELSEIDGLFITHEHTDHTRGAERLGKSIPVFISRKTYSQANLELKARFFGKDQILLNDLRITPVPLSHDAVDPHGFKISDGRANVGILTDFGKADALIKNTVNTADCLVLEANHDVDMLLKGPYPYPLKQRILGDKGHLSNIDAGLLVREHASDRLKKVFLAHLSRQNNTEEKAHDTFKRLSSCNAIMTKQDENTELIRLRS
jgi:phosphoribosyl 1,2-cyclic phosphodiesterase